MARKSVKRSGTAWARPGIRWLLSFLHAFVLIGIMAFWMNTGFTYGDEKLIIKWSSIFKRLVLQIDKDPPREDFIFINLAYDKALIPRTDGLGNEVISDREKLATLLKIIKKHQQQIEFTICDVFLFGQSDQDSSLQVATVGLRNVVFPIHTNESGGVESLALDVPAALADYSTGSSGFIKFKLFQHDSLETVPVRMYSTLHGSKFRHSRNWWFEGGTPVLNTLIVDYQIRAYELLEQNEYPVVTLSELLLLPEETVFSEFLKGRIIVIGDLKSDTHDTVYGPTPGTLILLNVYLTLRDGFHRLSLWFILYLLTGFTLFSKLVLFPPQRKERPESPRLAGILVSSATYLIIMSVISYLLFNQHIQVLVLTVYITLLRFIMTIPDLDWNKVQWKKSLMKLKSTYFSFK